jgi:hypothetical protein
MLIFVSLAIVTIAASTSAVGHDMYGVGIAFGIVLIIFSGFTLIFDIVNLVLAIKLVKRIIAAERNVNLYDMQQFGGSEPHPQPVHVQQQAQYASPYATQQMPMPYMTAVPAGATMVPMGTMAPMYSPQQMGVVYTQQPYAIPPTLTQ